MHENKIRSIEKILSLKPKCDCIEPFRNIILTRLSLFETLLMDVSQELFE